MKCLPVLDYASCTLYRILSFFWILAHCSKQAWLWDLVKASGGESRDQDSIPGTGNFEAMRRRPLSKAVAHNVTSS